MSTLAPPTPLAWFAAHEARLIWRDFASMMTAGRPQRMALVGLVLAAFIIGVHIFAAHILAPFVADGIVPTPQTLLLASGALIMFASLMISQAIESVTRAYYARDDLDLILSSPASSQRLFKVRTGILAVQTTALSLLVASPLINTLIWLDGPRWFAAYATLAALGLLTTAMAVGLTLLLFRTVGAQRTRLIAQIVAAVVGAGFVIALQAFAILFGQGLGRFSFFTSGDTLAAAPAVDSLLWLPAKAAMGDPVALAIIALLCAAAFGVALVVSARRFGTDVLAAAGLRERQVRKAAFAGFARNRSVRGNLRAKEWRLLARDPWLVSQTLQQVLYLLPAALMLYVNHGDSFGLYAVIVPVIVMAAGQLAGGLAWLSISGEDAHELIATAPVPGPTVIRAKIEAVFGVIALVLAPFAVALAIFAPIVAVIMLLGAGASAACAVLVQMLFRSQAKRSMFRRRQVSSKAATICEALASIFCAATAGLFLAVPDKAWVPIVLLMLVLMFARAVAPRENRV